MKRIIILLQLLIPTIGIITSGNDAPGMNSAIRAVTRAAIYNGLKVKAVYRGYKGLIDGDIVDFESHSVSNIIQQGGTILKSSPSKDFRDPEGRKKAYENIKKENIDALVVMGGDGTIHGARIFAQEYDFPCIAIPATIDNNLCGTEVLLESMVAHGIDKIVFSSTAATDVVASKAVGLISAEPKEVFAILGVDLG